MSVLWLWDDTFGKFPSPTYCVLLCGCLGALVKSPFFKSPRPRPRLHDNIVNTKGKAFPLPFQKLSVFKRRRCQTNANSQGSATLTENAGQSSSWRCAERVMHSHRASLNTVLPVLTQTKDRVFRFLALEPGFRFRHSGHHSCVNKRRKRNQPLPFLSIFIIV